jgi:hypothetical protein
MDSKDQANVSLTEQLKIRIDALQEIFNSQNNEIEKWRKKKKKMVSNGQQYKFQSSGNISELIFRYQLVNNSFQRYI